MCFLNYAPHLHPRWRPVPGENRCLPGSHRSAFSSDSRTKSRHFYVHVHLDVRPLLCEPDHSMPKWNVWRCTMIWWSLFHDAFYFHDKIRILPAILIAKLFLDTPTGSIHLSWNERISLLSIECRDVRLAQSHYDRKDLLNSWFLFFK